VLEAAGGVFASEGDGFAFEGVVFPFEGVVFPLEGIMSSAAEGAGSAPDRSSGPCDAQPLTARRASGAMSENLEEA
jgi:hypothetical protein